MHNDPFKGRLRSGRQAKLEGHAYHLRQQTGGVARHGSSRPWCQRNIERRRPHRRRRKDHRASGRSGGSLWKRDRLEKHARVWRFYL